MRATARSLHAELIEVFDPERLLGERLSLKGTTLSFAAASWDLSAYREVVVIAIGKASIKMARAAEKCFGSLVTRGLVVGVAELDVPSPWPLILGGHPLPDAESLRAGQAALDLLASCDHPDCLVMFLISGGGSALLEVPCAGLSLEDLIAEHRSLVTSSLPIAEINRARSALSQTKAGGLARAAGRAKQVSIYLSDVEPGDLGSIASGPSMDPEADAGSSAHLLLLDSVGATKLAAEHLRAHGAFEVALAEDPANHPGVEDVTQLSERLLAELRSQKRHFPRSPVVLLSMGESVCKVEGKGIGGRNQELVLRIAIAAGAQGGLEYAALSAGTDGIDGNSPAAGALADDTSLARAAELGLDPQRYLQGSDAYHFFERLGDSLITGASGTNLRDLRLLLAR